MSDHPETWAELEQYVHQVLCQKENLIPEQFPLETRTLQRVEKFCGLEFTLYGPRQIRLGAVWAADVNTLYLYDARGRRYETVKLKRRPVAEPTATSSHVA
ncbi:MAG: hypothetical protein JKY95_05580 [Planctomycetaceae bacterium]|nr:hypothetical protein [Planctomycetaceae bacterium]